MKPKKFIQLSWLALIIVASSSLFFVYNYYSRAMPMLDIQLRMDRHQALEQAQRISERLKIGPSNARSVAFFASDFQLQSYIELQKDGKKAFKKLINEHTIEANQWKVRRYAEGKAHELYIFFTAQGQPYGFSELIPESMAGPSLSVEEARKIAEESARKDWNIDFSHYSLVEHSQEIKISKRTDHSFSYEKKGLKVFDAPVRLSLTVSGDKLSSLAPYVKIPEAFSRQYNEMRSANKYISLAGNIAFLVLYLFGGCIVALAFLYRQRLVICKQAFMLAAALAALTLATAASNFTELFLHYNTAISINSFILQQILSILLQAFSTFTLCSLALMAAEGLTRLAFPTHMQFWQLFSHNGARTATIWQQTFIAYAAAAIFLGYVVAIYWLAYTYLHWWSPSESLIDPNIVSSYAPALIPLSSALQAGLIEECLFRAIPLSLAALLGQKIGKRKVCLGIALFAQALIFGACHANYPVQPAYARLLELIIPSLAFGLLYLRFGLLPGVLCHVIYDLILMSSPLFISANNTSLFSKLFIITAALSPVLILGYRRLKNTKFSPKPSRLKLMPPS